MSAETTFVLKPDASTSAEGKTFGVFPGVWAAGEPKAAADIGLDEAEAKAQIAELGLPIDVIPGTKPKPEPKDEAKVGGTGPGAKPAEGDD